MNSKISTSLLPLLLLSPAAAQALPPVYVPWPCGTSYEITQGHGGGSHADAINRWAWDIGIPVGADVVAPADGVVRAIRMDSTRGGCDSSYINDANYVVIDFGDGTDANFTHLQANSSDLAVGSAVRRGDVVGKVGLTGWVCGAHLHFQFQNTCSSAACNSIQAEFEGFGDPAYGAVIESNNCPAAPCDLLVDSSAELLIDEKNESCFERITRYFWPVHEGHEDHHYFTYTAQSAEPETIGRWHFEVAEGGTYEVRAFIPETEVSSTAAVYTVETSTGTVTSAPLDQSSEKGWRSLGVYDLPAGPASVALTDDTGEDAQKLAFDALSLVWVPPPAPMEPDEQPSGDMDHDAGRDGADMGIPPSTTPPMREADAGDGEDEATDPMLVESRGAACSSARAAVDSKLAFLLFALTMMATRRRRA